ncbi:hypothetical protein [Streptomyces sp. NPDC058385]|uniref:lactate/malate family dehydrogenase n=1 Tax=Streptomyces sp. NPDC058385 TaxID=3346473 RepID=UPI0036699277
MRSAAGVRPRGRAWTGKSLVSSCGTPACSTGAYCRTCCASEVGVRTSGALSPRGTEYEGRSRRGGRGRVGNPPLSLVERGGSCQEIVLGDLDAARADGVASDLRYAAPLLPTVDVRSGGYEDLSGAAIVVITAGVNEKAGGATDRSDPDGRLRLLETSAEVFAEILPQVVAVAPGAVLMVVTCPPDPLADLTRHVAGHDRVFSTGTVIDSLRFRVQLADRLKVRPRDVQAMVVGEHGTSEVLLWSSATVGGIPVADLLGQDGRSVKDTQQPRLKVSRGSVCRRP